MAYHETKTKDPCNALQWLAEVNRADCQQPARAVEEVSPRCAPNILRAGDTKTCIGPYWTLEIRRKGAMTMRPAPFGMVLVFVGWTKPGRIALGMAVPPAKPALKRERRDVGRMAAPDWRARGHARLGSCLASQRRGITPASRIGAWGSSGIY